MTSVDPRIRKELERIIAPIVRGQIKSFFHAHPEARSTRTFSGSIAKRIISDLLCDHTIMRLIRLFSGYESAETQSLESDEGASVAPLPAEADEEVATINTASSSPSLLRFLVGKLLEHPR